MSRRRGVLGCLATLTLVVLVVCVAALALRERSRRADERLLARWADLLGGESFPERFPPTEPNETALRLGALGAAMGLEMVPAEVVEGPRPSEASAARFAEHKRQLEEYLDAVAAGPSRAAWPPVPAELGDLLEEVQPRLGELVVLLRDAPPPVWRSDLSRGIEAPLPNFLGVLRLQDVLVARAASQAHDGRPERALELLEASWRLNQAVLARVSLLAQLVGQRAVSRQAGVLRGVCGAPRHWQERLAGLDLQEGIFVALHAEAFMAYRSASLDPFPGTGLQEWSVPFMRWGLRDYAHRFQRILDDLATEDVRTFDPDAFLDRAMAGLPRWQIVARILLPNMFATWPESARHDLETELTRHVLVRRAALAADAAAGPSAPGGVVVAARVPGLSWVIDTDAAGVSVRLDGDLAHKHEDAPPLRFRIERDDC